MFITRQLRIMAVENDPRIRENGGIADRHILFVLFLGILRTT